jgi:hypothetical protein
MQSSKTANYKAVADQAGHRFLFYCQVSGAHVRITKEIYPGQLEEALGLAWKNTMHRKLRLKDLRSLASAPM